MAASLAGCGASLNEGVSDPSAFQTSQAGAAGAKQAVSAAASGDAAPAAPKREAAVRVSSAAPAASLGAASSGGAAGKPKTIDDIAAIATPGSASYLIGPQDMLEVTVFKVKDLSSVVQVSEAGSINLPLVGNIPASGRTAHQLEQELTSTLGAKYLQNPQVNVLVKEYNSQRVTLEGGGVKKPGVYPLKGRMTLLQVIATAEGLTDIADSQVAIFRQKNGKRVAARFDVSAIRTGDIEDPPIQAGDVIVATTSATKEAFNNVMKAVPLVSVFRPTVW